MLVPAAGVVAKEAAECSRHEQLKLVQWYLVRIPRQDDRYMYIPVCKQVWDLQKFDWPACW